MLHQFDAGAVRQANIAHQHVELLLRRRLERTGDVDGRLDFVAAAPQQLGEGAVGILVIFHQQDAERFAFRRGRRRPGCPAVRLGGPKAERRAVNVAPWSAACALGGDLAVVRLDQCFADRQAEAESAEPRAFALLESIEDFRQRLGIDPAAGVRDVDRKVAIVVIARADAQPAVPRG